MYGKTRTDQMQKSHKAKQGKSGFTLVELCVVLTLLAILTALIVSFSVLMNGFAADNEAEYEFLEDQATLKEMIGAWVTENDITNNVFTANADGTLSVSENGTLKTVSFADGILTLGGQQKAGLDAIDGVIFTSNGKLIKCVTYRIEEGGERTESSFVLSLRCGTIRR